MWQVMVEVMPKKGILNPEGSVIQEALLSLGYKGVSHLKVGKTMKFYLEGSSQGQVEEQVQKMCKQLLANPVIEDYTYTILAEGDKG